MSSNPFEVVTPETLSAEKANQLFVEVHSDYPEITREGNTLVMGARGCGKSMLIRCSLPDFLMVRNKLDFSELPYLSINVSVEKTNVNIAELLKLNHMHMPYLINEHYLTLLVLQYTFLLLSKVKYNMSLYDREAYVYFYEKVFLRYYKLAGGVCDLDPDYTTPQNFFDSIYQYMVDLAGAFRPYLINLYNTNQPSLLYDFPLLSFSKFIVPVYTEMRNLPCFPKDKPIFIFIDDADNLSNVQTEILNSWIASRTQPTISLKVFSQIGLYKTFLTPTRNLIEAPHDYQELDMSARYTTRDDRYTQYYHKVIRVLFRRMKIAGYFSDVDETDERAVEDALRQFFPCYEEQERGIQEEAQRIRAAYNESGRGYRLDDDIRRYATPNYIRKLAGTRKAKSTFRYAGLSYIIHLSSGIIRYLIDSVAKMYDIVSKTNPGGIVEFIPTGVQNNVLREKADFYLFIELPKSAELTEYNKESGIDITSNPQCTTEKLANLINAMGKTFQEILLSGSDDDPFSGRSERKVFSLALSQPNSVSKEIKEVFALGVRLGFLHKTHIGTKEGNCRTPLFILNRCFAPIFTLDPSGFQGYLFMKNEDIKKAIYTGQKLRDIDKALPDGKEDLYQLTMDDIWEG